MQLCCYLAAATPRYDGGGELGLVPGGALLVT